MANLLKETIECLEDNGKRPSDVLWVGRYHVEACRNAAGKTIWHPRYCKSTWHDFCSKADFEYDNGYGLPEIPTDLIVVGKDFWLERHDYDGSEWWEFKTMPEEPEETAELDFKAEF